MKVSKNLIVKILQNRTTHIQAKRKKERKYTKIFLSFLISFLVIFETIFTKTSTFQTSERLKPTAASAADEPITEFDPTSDLDISALNEPSSFENIEITLQEVIITIADNNTFTINNGGATSASYSLTNKGINFTSIANATGKVKVTGGTNKNTIPIQIKLSGIDLHTPDASGAPISLENHANTVLILGEGENKVITQNYGIQVLDGSEITITSNNANNSLYISGNCTKSSLIGGKYGYGFTDELIINICGCANVTAESTAIATSYCASIGGGISNYSEGHYKISINICQSANVYVKNSSAVHEVKNTAIGSGGMSTQTVGASFLNELFINIGGNANVTVICELNCNTNSAYNIMTAIGSGPNNLGPTINIGGSSRVNASTSSFSSVLTDYISWNYGVVIGASFYRTACNINIGGNSIVDVASYGNNYNGYYSVGIGMLCFSGDNVAVQTHSLINIGGNCNITANCTGISIGAAKTLYLSSGIEVLILNINGNARIIVNNFNAYEDEGECSLIGGTGGTYSASVIVSIGENAKVCAIRKTLERRAGFSGKRMPAIVAKNISGNAVVVAKTYNAGESDNDRTKNEAILLENMSGNCFIIASGCGLADAAPINTNGYDTHLTGGSLFCKNINTDTFRGNNGHYTYYPCYCPRTIEDTDLQNKNILIPLEGDTFYKARTFNNEIKEFLQSNNLTDLFPEDILSACLWLPQKDSYDQIRVSRVSNKLFKSNVAANKESYTVNPGPDNWLSKSTSPITPPVVDASIPSPTVDTTPAWFVIKSPALTGTGIPGYYISIIDGTTVIGEGVVDEDGKWRITLNDRPEGQKTVSVSQVDEFFQKCSNGISKAVNIDTTKPTGRITIDSNIFEGLLHDVTFGLLFKDRVHVNVLAEDNIGGSGVLKIDYAVSFLMLETESDVIDLEYKDAGTLSSDNSVTVSFDPDLGYGEAEFGTSFFFYARITDIAGNKYYLNTDSITIYVDTEKPEPELPGGGVGPGDGTGTGGAGTGGGSGTGGTGGTGTGGSGGIKDTGNPAQVKEIGENDIKYKKVEEQVKKEEKKIKKEIEDFKVYTITGTPGDYFELPLGENFGKNKTYIVVHHLGGYVFDGEVIKGNPYVVRGKCVKGSSTYVVMEVQK